MFSILWNEKLHKTKTIDWHNEQKPTENELKMSNCLLTFYLNHFNESEPILEGC